MRGRKDHKEVTLSTVHGFKGLESNCVMLIGCSQRDFPSKRSINEGRLEEERRLFYVAITRAREKLYIFAPEGHGGRTEPASQFLRECEVDNS
jgi:DNA helicase-2/ATP-dependent DNA helicase PcrA